MFQRTPNHIGDVTAYRPDNAGKRDAVMNKAFDVAYEIPLSSSKSQDAYVPVDIAFQTSTDIEDVEQIIHRLGVNTDLQNVATGHRRPSALNGAQALVSGHAELAQPLIECVDSDGGLVDLIEETDEGYDPAVHKLSSEDHFYYLVNRGRFTGKMQAMHTNFHENCMRIRKECANAVFLRFYSKDHCGDESKVTGEIIVREPALVEVVSFDLSNARTIEYDSPVRMPIGSTKGPAVLMEMAFLNEGELVSFMQGIGAYEQSKAYLAHSLLPVDLPQCGNEKSFDCKSRVNAAAASSHADRGISFQEAAKKQVSWEDEGSLFARATQSEEVDIGTRAFMDDVSFFSTLETHVGAVQEGNTVWLNFVLRELAQHFGNENAYRPKETDRHGNGYGHGYAYGDIDDRKPTARRRTDSYATDSSKGDASTKDEQDPISMTRPDSSIFTDKRLRLYPTCQFLDAAMRPGAQATRGMCDVFYAMRKYTEIFHRIGFKDAVVGTWHAIIAKATPDKRKQLEQREGNIVHLLKIMGKFNNEHAANDASAHGGAYICNRLKFGFDWFIQKSLDAKSGRTSVSEMTKLMIRLSTVSAALMDQVSIVEGMLAAGLTNAAVGMYSRKKNAKEEGQRAMLQVWINALDEVIQYPPSEANLSCRRTVNRLLKQMTSIIEYRKLKFAKDGSIAVPISYPRPAVIYYSKLMRESAENYHKYLRMVDNQFVDDVRDAIEWVIWYENAGSYYTENQWW